MTTSKETLAEVSWNAVDEAFEAIWNTRFRELLEDGPHTQCKRAFRLGAEWALASATPEPRNHKWSHGERQTCKKCGVFMWDARETICTGQPPAGEPQ